jgi:peptidoglycan lytic transglycosylase
MPRKKRPLRAAAPDIVARRRSALPACVGAAAALIASVAAAPTADAKSPGTRYCFHGYCYRVGTLAQTDTLVGWRGYVHASYYDSCHRDRLNPCGLTSSGAVFRADRADNAASPLLPDGTVILAYNPDTDDASVLRINNAGPYSGKRKLDVSRAAAEKLGFARQGVASLVITVLQSPTKSEASYVKRRVYPKVPGYIGKFATVDLALAAAQARFDAREWDDPFVDGAEAAREASALVDGDIPTPQRAVSPSLARELVMLRLPPRPVNREVQLVEGPQLIRQVASRPVPDPDPAPSLVQGPRLVSRAAFTDQPPPEPVGATEDYLSGLWQYLRALGAPDASN